MMDSKDALELLRSGGTVLCLNGPDRLEFGIDQQTWISKNSNVGLKMIPPGFHFIHWKPSSEIASVSKSDDRIKINSSAPVGAIVGMFIFISPAQMIIRQWDPYLEDFVPLSQEDSQRYEHGISQYDFDQYLGAFPRENLSSWENLTKFISPKTVRRCAPRYNSISVLPYAEMQQEQSDSIRTKISNEESNKVNSLDGPQSDTKFDSLHSFRFPALPSRWVPPGLSGAELTRYFMDRSAFLEHIISTLYKNNWLEFLGEFQFAFISFWLAESYEGFEHWKALVTLLSSCESALEDRVEFFVQFLDCFAAQLQIVPEDFFVDILSCENFLEPALRSLFELLEDPGQDGTLIEHYITLKKIVESRFKKSFSVVEIEDCFAQD